MKPKFWEQSINNHLNEPLGVGSSALHHLKSIHDAVRGDLCIADFTSELPFLPKRFFCVYNVPNQIIRGEHAHRNCQQFLVCVSGSCTVQIDDGFRRKDIELRSPKMGLYIPTMVWASQFNYSADACLVVFASAQFSEQDYIRDYESFKRLRGINKDR
jgi:UDP-2-acetamido-3-amino-2,3-dideoxy-glucuronate N-acetyltransferase